MTATDDPGLEVLTWVEGFLSIRPLLPGPIRPIGRDDLEATFAARPVRSDDGPSPADEVAVAPAAAFAAPLRDGFAVVEAHGGEVALDGADLAVFLHLVEHGPTTVARLVSESGQGDRARGCVQRLLDARVLRPIEVAGRPGDRGVPTGGGDEAVTSPDAARAEPDPEPAGAVPTPSAGVDQAEVVARTADPAPRLVGRLRRLLAPRRPSRAEGSGTDAGAERPDVELPHAEAPEIELPHAEAPEIEVPEAERRDPSVEADVPAAPDSRIPVYAIWHPETGPLLSLGMLTAAARTFDGGALLDRYEIRRPETAESFLADLADRPGPAVLLCSDYVWTLENNLEAARAGLRLNPQLVVLHGGPSSPKFEADAERFLDDHGPVAHVLTRSEGEHLLCDVLDALAPELPDLDVDALAEIPGLTFRHPRSGATVRTPDRDRIADLDALASPYLTGEFDDIPIDRWLYCLSIETNRGCPYSCSYCDWGSSTLSRIRKFSLERVRKEIEWAAERGAGSINLPDANFGIMSRDVEVAQVIADARQRTGSPALLSFYPAKNTTKHLVRIMDVLMEGGVGTTASISLQTTDEATLEAIDRSNISTDHYVALAASYRRRGFPIQGDLLIGLPGQSYASYRSDLQFNLDHEIQARTWQLKILPNAPMNAPEYRERFQIESDAQHRVRSTSTFTPEDRVRMLRLRDLDIAIERLGLLRHVLRFVQWEHQVAATEVLDVILDLADRDPARYPSLTWLTAQYAHVPAPLGGWPQLYREARELLASELGVPSSPGLDTAFAANEFLMPWPGRPLPDRMALAHDYVSYLRDATRSLYEDGAASGPRAPLAAYGPATLEVGADPLELCTDGLRFPQHADDDSMESDYSIGANSSNELLSALTRLQPHLLAAGVTVHDLPEGAPSAQGLDLHDVDDPTGPQPVHLRINARA